jgi:hypothetical protein
MRPCWASPEDAIKLIELEYGPMLMNDFWVGERYDNDDEDIEILGPAVVGYEGKRANGFITFSGPCVFLTSEGACELHSLGLKPLEGRLALHGMESNKSYSIHKEIAMMWNNKEGQELVEKWRERVKIERNQF